MHGTAWTANAHAIGCDSPTASAFFAMETGAVQQEIKLKALLPKQPNNPCLNAMVTVKLMRK